MGFLEDLFALKERLAQAVVVLITAIALWFGIQFASPQRNRGLRSDPTTTYPRVLASPWLQHLYVIVNGLKVHAITPKPEASPSAAPAPARKPLMLCLHGFPESVWSWRAFLAAYKDSHYVVAVDMPGYGETGALAAKGTYFGSQGPEAYSVPRLVEYVRSFALALGYDKCVLVGHDWGGMVAWNVAMKHPELVEKLVVLSCPHPACWLPNLSLSQLSRSWYIGFFQLPGFPEWILSRQGYGAVARSLKGKRMGVTTKAGPYTLTSDDVAVAQWSVSRNLTACVNYYRAVLWDTLSSRLSRKRGVDPKLPMPVLLLWGGQDGALGTELMRGTAQHVTGPYRERVWPTASHWLQQEGQVLEEVLAEVGDFLGAKPDIQETRRLCGREALQ